MTLQTTKPENKTEAVETLLNQFDRRWETSTPNDCSRLVSWHSGDDAEGSPRLVLYSDGWNLQQKLEVEKAIRHGIGDMATKIYFKRCVAKPRKQPTASPEPEERQRLGHIGSIIAIASGKGGVGKSTVTANLAVSMAAEGLRVGVLDADIYGPSMPKMLGVDSCMKVNDDEQLEPNMTHGVKVASAGFFIREDQAILSRAPVVTKLLDQLLFQTNWGHLDYLLVDFPPGTGDIQIGLLDAKIVDRGIIVSTPSVVAVLDAMKAVNMFARAGLPIIGFVENMAGHTCSNCGHTEQVFGDGTDPWSQSLEKGQNLRMLGRVPLDARIRSATDTGTTASCKTSYLADTFQPIVHRITDDF